MASTYNQGLVSSKDRVRQRLSDIGSYDSSAGGSQTVTKTYKSDEEIIAMITAHGELGALWRLASSLAIYFSTLPDDFQEAGGITVSYKNRVTQLNQLAKEIRQEESPDPTNNERGVHETNSLTNCVNW